MQDAVGLEGLGRPLRFQHVIGRRGLILKEGKDWGSCRPGRVGLCGAGGVLFLCLSFYRGRGYREEARVADYYDLGDDKVILVKRL